MATSHVLLKCLRQIHLYVGLFISPAILFFAFTGALQTFSLHETTKGSDYKPAAWIMTLAQLHKKQTIQVPQRRPNPALDKPKTDKPADAPTAASMPAPAPGPISTPPKQKSHLPMKVFFLLVAVSLCTSTLTGIYMAYKYARNKFVVTGLLIAGVIVPLLLLPF